MAHARAVARVHGRKLLEARALDAAGFFMGLRGDFDGARAKIDRAVQLCRELDEPSALAWMLIRNGLVLSVQGASDDATSPFREGLDLMKSEGDTDGQAWGHLELRRVYFLLDELGPALAEFDLAAKDRTAHDPTTVSYGRVGAEACRIVSGSGSSSVLSDAVDELLRMQLMYTSTHGLLLACAAAVSGARYTDAARYSSLALECTHRSGGVTQAAHAVEWAAQSRVATKRWERAALLWGYVVVTRARLGAIEPPIVRRLQPHRYPRRPPRRQGDA